MTADLDETTDKAIATLLTAWAGPSACVVETHGARVFIGPTEVLKIKRPVALAYMDFSTRDKRHAACRREVEVNRQFAPDLYLGLISITRESDGSLALNGHGDVLEMAVHMRAFAEADGLDHVAAQGPLPAPLVIALGDRVARMHQCAAAVAPGSGRPLTLIRERLLKSAVARTDIFGHDQVRVLEDATTVALERARSIIDQRRTNGITRRCHGDLHLGNIVLWSGQPTPFDAIEFDEDLASLDPVYDLAFLLMDLCERNQRPAATLVLNRYLWRCGRAALADGTWDMLQALPLCLSLRALVRAVVAVERAGPGRTASVLDEARRYFGAACHYATPPPPRLIAIGGLSGTGKSTLAAELAPDLGAAPGAIHLRSDVERKGLFGVEPETRLGSDGYTTDASQRTYALVYEKAARALAAGHSVIVDAVFAKPEEQAALATIAQQNRAPFIGLWLNADGATLRERVAQRVGDASDATVDVLEKQLTWPTTATGWHMITASGDVSATAAAARAVINAAK